MRFVFSVWVIAGTLVPCGEVVLAQTSASGTSVSPSAPDLSGTWDAIQRSYGGIGSTVLLSRDSTFTLVLGAMVDLRYKVDGRKFMILPDANSKPVEAQTLNFDKGQAVLSANGCSRKLTRLDSIPGDSGLVGRWKSLHMTGVPAYEEYTADGRSRMRVPIQVQKGSFSLAGNSVLFHTVSPQPEDWAADYELKGDTLTFSIRGQGHRYLRARPLIPYDVEQPAKPDHLIC
jgi:hypothetical protein